jgi:DNA-binding cell septation regulator SpoVG
MMEQPQIRVDLRRANGKSAVKAYADVTILTALGEITFRGSRVLQKDGQDPWVALPSSTYQKGGKLQRVHLLEARQAVLCLVKDAILIDFRKLSSDPK